MKPLRVGIVGLGANTRLRHVPGLRACEAVEIAAVCNRRPESTRAAAAEFNIPRTYDQWQQLVDDPELDAVVIGTWPYLHAPITIAALEAGKHVLTEARMARNLEEARRMKAAADAHPERITQIVPSPLGLRGHQVVRELLAQGFLGELRQFVVLGTSAAAADPDMPLHWRQDAELSGLNMLALGILHEPLIRWLPDPVRVLAQTHIFTRRRPDETGTLREVGTPDTVRVLTELPHGARGVYHLSGVMHFGPAMQIHLYGSEGTLKYQFAPDDQLYGGRRGDADLQPIEIPPEKAGGWRVEQDFVDAIRGRKSIEFTDFATGVRYMEFTEAVARSAASGCAVPLPLTP